MAEVKGVALLLSFIGNLILQLTAAVANLVTITTNRTQACNCCSSPKRVKKAIKKAFKKIRENTEETKNMVSTTSNKYLVDEHCKQ